MSNNGGCSHQCVNTPGGHKCECPDPELILSPDNKTCYGKQFSLTWKIIPLGFSLLLEKPLSIRLVNNNPRYVCIELTEASAV